MPVTIGDQELPSFEEQAVQVYAGGFCPDGGYIDKALIDQWWHIYVACDHGQWRGVSNGPVDLGRGLERAIVEAKKAHEGLGQCPSKSPKGRRCELTEKHLPKHGSWPPEGGRPIETWD